MDPPSSLRMKRLQMQLKSPVSPLLITSAPRSDRCEWCVCHSVSVVVSWRVQLCVIGVVCLAHRKTLFNCFVLCLLFCSFFHCKFYARDPGVAHSFSPLWGIPLCACPTVHVSLFPLPVSFYGCSSGTTLSIPVRVSPCSRVLVPLGCRSTYQSCKTNDSQTGHVTPTDSGLGTRTGHRGDSSFLLYRVQGLNWTQRWAAGCPLVLSAELWATVLSMWLVWLHSLMAKSQGAAP